VSQGRVQLVRGRMYVWYLNCMILCQSWFPPGDGLTSRIFCNIHVSSRLQWRIAGIVLNLTCSCVRKLNHRGVVVKKFHGVCILVLDADSNVEATGSPEAVRMMTDEQKQTNTIEMRRRAHRVPAKEVVEIIIRFILPPFHSPPSTSNPPHKITPH
jgi:hypothetical protein